jgi:ferrochelatase
MRASTQDGDRWGILLLAHGAPDRLEDIPEFLLRVRGGRPLPDEAVHEIVARYRMIGGGSPLLRLTREQAQALEKASGLPVYVGMRNWKPFIQEAVERIRDDGLTHVVAICLAPQNSRTSVGLYRQHLAEAVARCAPGLYVEFVESWHDQPSFIAALAWQVEEALTQAEKEAGGPVPVMFTAHSVPERTVAAGDPYDAQVRETAALVAGKLGTKLSEWRLAYQSQGMTAEAWIGPTVESQIDELATAGHRHVLIAPVGFVSDHVEVLYDIDVVFSEYGKQRGVRVWRIASLNNSPLLIDALTALAFSRIPTHFLASVLGRQP